MKISPHSDSPHTDKRYQCTNCGHETQIRTNHYRSCHSWGRHNCCPWCPPHKKYPEYGGRTVWKCLESPMLNQIDLVTLTLGENEEEVVVYREPGGGVWAVDASYVEQEAGPLFNPFTGEQIKCQDVP